MSYVRGGAEGMDENRIQQVLSTVEAMLREKDVTVSHERSIKRTTEPGGAFETYAPGQGRRITIELPCLRGEGYSEQMLKR